MTFVLAKISLKLEFTKSAQQNLSGDKICTKSLNYFEFKLTNLVKQKHFSLINASNMLFKIIKQICYFFLVKLCKNSNICVLL